MSTTLRSRRFAGPLALALCFALMGSMRLLPAADASVLPNGDFEAGLSHWQPFWSRDTGTGQALIDATRPHGGQAALRIEHRGERDWCVNAAERVPVQPGDQFELSGWARLAGDGDATLCVILYDARGEALDWAYGAAAARRAADWQSLRSRLIIPPGAAAMLPRWLGSGPVTAWVDDVILRRTGRLDVGSAAAVGGMVTASNASLIVMFHASNATFSVQDRRTGQTWRQAAPGPGVLATAVQPAPDGFAFRLVQLASGLEIEGRVRLEPAAPEMIVSLQAGDAKKGDADRNDEHRGAGSSSPLGNAQALGTPLRFPLPFVSDPGTYLVVPMNEGISYPVEDRSIEPMRLVAYGGHGICMAFWGVTDGERGHMAILETADDAAIRIDRFDGRLFVAPEWESQQGTFGYPRTLRYVFLDRGGHVAVAQRYRAYATQIGRVKTFEQKRAANPNVDQLIGAVNVWCWERDALGIARELQAAGIRRILWSNRQPPETLRALNALGVLTSRYDIYQDVMDPANFRHLRNVHADWTTAAWPKDIIVDAHGNWLRGWGVQGTNGQWYACGVICDRQALPYAAERIPKELATHPYRSRFIDTTTAAPWHECYVPEHPMTRTDSRVWKMKLLEYVSRDQKLVTGCETGHDAAVPFLHYFEGMLSLGPYRVPDSGRDMMRVWDDVPERVAKFQLGHRYRLPLWELVYHDCVVAQWYWGDYNNKLPALWDKRDQFNALYGTPPMFMFNRQRWQELQPRFVASYRATAPIARATGYHAMTDHRFLTPDRDVQQTQFANGVQVTVNFGTRPYRLPDGTEVPAGKIHTTGLPSAD